MTNPQPHIRKPTPGQESYLRHLVEATGETYSVPRTFAEASKQIDELKQSTPTSRAERRRETLAVRRDIATFSGDAARVRDEEIGGYGASAHWADDSDEDRDDWDRGR